MKTYKALGIVDIFGGLIGLTKKQVAVRPGTLNKVRTGVYEVYKPVQFKAGEVIGLENPDKVTLSRLDELKKGKNDL